MAIQLSLNSYRTMSVFILSQVLLDLDIFFLENSVGPGQMASEEAIWSASTPFSNMLIAGMLNVNRSKIREECSTKN